jgi:hypothetical protein
MSGPAATRRTGVARLRLACRRGGAGLWRLLAVLACALLAGHAAAQQEEHKFDVGQFEKKPYEFGGFLEAKGERQRLDPGAALYPLQFPGVTEKYNDRGSGVAELSGTLRRDNLRAYFLAHGEYLNDVRASGGEAKFYEAYAAWQASANASLEAGKKTQRWGKGYAWSPVAFLERPKDPEDPELAREGFVAAAGSYVRAGAGALQSFSATALVLPTQSDLNADFGAQGYWNPAAKLTLLYRDTDIDFLWLGEGARGARYGFDLSRNLGTNLEVHAEWARILGFEQPVLDASGALVLAPPRDATSWLLGLRYLTERDTTWIVEYYRNGTGYTEAQAQAFFEAAHAGAALGALTPVLRSAAQAGYARPNAMQRYLYVRASQKEPFDILYFTPSLTTIVNLDGGSASLIGELLYTGFGEFEVRLRAAANLGDRLTEFGEKPVDERLELRLRWHF